MRKIIKLFVLLLILMPVSTFALSVDKKDQYDIDENMSVGFNSDWYVFTRDNYIGNKDLSSLGISEEKMKSIFDANHLYVDALNKKAQYLKPYQKKDFNKEFFIRKVSVPSDKNMRDYTDSYLKSFGDGFVSSLPTDEWDKYVNDNDTYLHINFVDTKSGKTLYMEEYVTVYDGYAYSFGLQTTGKVLTESDKKFVKDTVDEIVYKKETSTTGKKEESKDGDDKEEKKDNDDKKEETEDKENYFIFCLIALGIICITVVTVTLIVQQNKKKQI